MYNTRFAELGWAGEWQLWNRMIRTNLLSFWTSNLTSETSHWTWSGPAWNFFNSKLWAFLKVFPPTGAPSQTFPKATQPHRRPQGCQPLETQFHHCPTEKLPNSKHRRKTPWQQQLGNCNQQLDAHLDNSSLLHSYIGSKERLEAKMVLLQSHTSLTQSFRT